MTAVHKVVALGQLHLLVDALLHFGHKAGQVTAFDVGPHHDAALAAFTADLRWPIDQLNAGQARQRHLRTARCGQQGVANRFCRLAHLRREAHHHAVAALAFIKRGHVLAADSGFDDALHIGHVQAMACNGFAVNVHRQGLLPR